MKVVLPKPVGSEEIRQFFMTHGKPIKLKKKEYYAKKGIPLFSVGLVVSGGFKLIYKNGKKEWIKSFIFEDGILGSLPSVLENQPIPYSIIAIEPSEVIVLTTNEFKSKMEKENGYQNFLIQFLSKLYLKKEERVADFLLLEPEKRYKKFIQEYSHVLDRISQIDQAAYLGITNVALSRIKKRIFLKNP
ncbi:Crp/Fnr family transcriptional regulator [Leptospira bourretii]|uniref:Crp/Fnr family transcriptional regulator n=1 Tax=Leptospira bourretii TaxID=2484962 RepID=A0A4R9INS4_9LEPT|nr:Crp/Fnr family transcriptional regulator [Leptospira bourretii]TGK89340.1 Crp/Fnr family transcriptional regulator [Leptospira bourretii]TGK93492.1 Crp/Fnr family transcriptional regulator [Leptospira bourretii]TGL18425.1 Crp/Fnr family transcriptional regulator [Leptospira bourretii]TGL36203.1 Crp/Fnr family transcriptional regulator [Leptospira bourretii]